MFSSPPCSFDFEYFLRILPYGSRNIYWDSRNRKNHPSIESSFSTLTIASTWDMLKTKHRFRLLLDSCVQAGQPFVSDNTTPRRNPEQS
jgi:hypothetical protein